MIFLGDGTECTRKRFQNIYNAKMPSEHNAKWKDIKRMNTVNLTSLWEPLLNESVMDIV